MRILPVVTPTPDQLPILLENRPGVLVINGAAGSGKTTTALLRLTNLCGYWLSRKRRANSVNPVRVLVLTYNRTLEGYIRELATAQVAGKLDLAQAVAEGDIRLSINTFSKWAFDLNPPGAAPDPDRCKTILDALASGFGMSTRFISDEVEYLLGRFPVDNLDAYVGCLREGRGSSPRMDAATRRRLLDEVVYPYVSLKQRHDLRDWHDVTAQAASQIGASWDIIIVDEAQDFAANQIRALMAHAADPHSVTFVIDTAQRIYPRSFTWREAGITALLSRKLERNYRNTTQIAAFARSLLEGMTVGDQGSLPNFNQAVSEGPKPQLLIGRFSEQFAWALKNIVDKANLLEESVAFLHPLGGRWFDFTKTSLNEAGIPFVQLTRAGTWPSGEETVALSTIHSAKGLEFDHVIILGLNRQTTPHGDGEGDAQLETLRRLLAMGIGRARRTVTIGSKADEISDLVGILDPATYERIEL